MIGTALSSLSGGAIGGIAAGVGSLFGAHSSNKASKRAAKAQEKGQAAALQATQEAADLARSQAIPLFNSAQQNQQQGFQGALDIFGQTIPAQLNAFGGGNLNAQNTLLAGLDPQIQAILGGNVDLSGLQAQQVQQPDPSMFQQQLPEFESINQALGIQPPILGNPNQQIVDGPQQANPANLLGGRASPFNTGQQSINPFQEIGLGGRATPFQRLV
jgi:hypothetical protein